MPRTHFPVRGGAHSQTQYARARSSDASSDCEPCNEKSAEIQRLRQELTRARQGGRGPGAPLAAGSRMVWTALGVCGAGLLFALAAILRHG